LVEGSVNPAPRRRVHGAGSATRFLQGAAMRTARRAVLLSLAVLAALTLSVAALASVVDQVHGAGDELRRLGRELRADAALDSALREVLRCEAAKRQIVSELIAGRLTLAEAGERFRAASEESGHYPLGAFRATYAGACDRERWCKCALQCARG